MGDPAPLPPGDSKEKRNKNSLVHGSYYKTAICAFVVQHKIAVCQKSITVVEFCVCEIFCSSKRMSLHLKDLKFNDELNEYVDVYDSQFTF